jgi:hypothetical protein
LLQYSPAGGALIGVERSATAGAAIGAIAGDAGKSSAIGASAGGMTGRQFYAGLISLLNRKLEMSRSIYG